MWSARGSSICLSPIVRQRASWCAGGLAVRDEARMLRHQSFNGLPTTLPKGGLDYSYRHGTCGDLEEACCTNRRRSHSHDLPDPRERRRRIFAVVALCALGALGLVTRRPGASSPRFMDESSSRRVLLEDDDGSMHLSASPISRVDDKTRYESLLEADFGPSATTAKIVINGTRQEKKSKTQRKRDERHKAAAEKRRLAQEAEESVAFEERRQERLKKKEKLREEKQTKRAVMANMQGGVLPSR